MPRYHWGSAAIAAHGRPAARRILSPVMPCGTLRCYYIMRPTLVKKLIALLRHEHPVKEREGRAVIRAAKRGRRVMMS